MTIKAISKTIKNPLLKQIDSTIKNPVFKTLDNTMKNSVGIFRRNKNTVKDLACGLQEKYLKIRHNFGSKPIKYLGEEAIKKFIYIAPLAARGGNKLVRAQGQKNI